MVKTHGEERFRAHGKERKISEKHGLKSQNIALRKEDSRMLHGKESEQENKRLYIRREEKD